MPCSICELEATFTQEEYTDRRAAAETAYAIAVRYRNEDVAGKRRFDLAKVWAERSLELLESLPSDTIDDVAPTRSSVGGVPLPNLLHSGVVRSRLADILI